MLKYFVRIPPAPILLQQILFKILQIVVNKQILFNKMLFVEQILFILFNKMNKICYVNLMQQNL